MDHERTKMERIEGHGGGTTRYVTLEDRLIWPVKSIFSFSRLLFHD